MHPGIIESAAFFNLLATLYIGILFLANTLPRSNKKTILVWGVRLWVFLVCSEVFVFVAMSIRFAHSCR
jgi:hypothetical protein